ncbi:MULTISPECIES: MCE family protein [Rhodococcus]|uniref:MCE family protein n=1 Tax=Rhodococcus TaxID=1827 RepID=UPI0022364BE6|nr:MULTISPECIES: MCE family protein [Rhodococcus]MDI9941324.1 MCE family protein [Rhodococcus sp. IEGM 1351]MDJ0418548.1 MCE family protein [Rhodococcus opacus]UZG52821.1 MCE family protein [Rhodococcus opacus]
MTTRTRHLARRIPTPGKALAALLLFAVISTTVAAIATRDSTLHITAYFRNSIGLYEGDRVTIRGVPVGTVDAIDPMGDQVRVTLTVTGDHPVPADAGAAIIAPTLVTGRYVQLAPTYGGGARLEDGAEVPLEKTAVPVEYDQLKKQLTELSTELGPQGYNADGSLSELVASTGRALDGNGQSLKLALSNVSAAMQTLSDGGPDLFSTVRNLQVLVSALAASDQQIVGFSGELRSVSTLLNNNRTELDAALASIAALLPEIRGYVDDNNEALTTDVESLNSIATLLMNKQDNLAQILHVTPTALADLYNIYDPASNSLTGALAIPDLPDPMSFICALLTTVDAPQEECSRMSDKFGDMFGAAVRAAQGSAPTGPAPKLGELAVPGSGGTR